MEYLIILNKFEIDKEVLINKIKEKCEINEYKFDENNLIINSDNFDNGLISFHEINKIIEIRTKWKKLNFNNLKEDCFISLNNFKSYIIETNFLNKIPISSKSIYRHINPYLKHEEKIVDEENYEAVIYIEFKKEKEIFYRIGISRHNLWNKTNQLELNFSNFYITLEEPRLVEELSDFLRLGWIFKMNLLILTKDENRITKILKKAKETTKGIDYNKFNVRFIPHLSKDFIKVGFSKHSNENEKNLIEFLKDNYESKICLIFGNDTYGLTQETRDDLDKCFRLTPDVKKPLKANQALSYVLGIYSGIKLGNS